MVLQFYVKSSQLTVKDNHKESKGTLKTGTVRKAQKGPEKRKKVQKCVKSESC